MLHVLAARTMSVCMRVCVCVCVSMNTSFLLFVCPPSCTWWLIRNCKEIQSSHSKNCWELCVPPSNLKQSNIWPDELYYCVLVICSLSEGNFLTEDSYSLRWSSACMLSHISHVQLFATPWTLALQAPLSMGFSRQEYWSGSPCAPPGIFATQIKSVSLVSRMGRQVLYH